MSFTHQYSKNFLFVHFSGKRNTNNPRTGVGCNGCSDLVYCRWFIAQFLHHQTTKFFQTGDIVSINNLVSCSRLHVLNTHLCHLLHKFTLPRHLAAVVMEQSAIFITGFKFSFVPQNAAAVGIRPDFAAYFKSYMPKSI